MFLNSFTKARNVFSLTTGNNTFLTIPSGLLIKTQNKDGKHLIYNIQEKKHISKKQFDKLGSSYQNGFLLAERNGKEFFIDEKGKEYIYP